jgi:DNA uptake protein ComE-like DNA-binding protein
MDVRRPIPSPPLALALALGAWAAAQALLWAVESAPPRPTTALPRALTPDVNRSPMRHLMLLPQVGPARARAIREERARAGPFAGPVDLQRVRGIGPRIAAGILEVATADAP